MATIYGEFLVAAPSEFVWEVFKDVGAVRTRLARGFVTDTVPSGTERTVTFANGFVAKEETVSIGEGEHRPAYTLVGGAARHHNASFDFRRPAPVAGTLDHRRAARRRG